MATVAEAPAPAREPAHDGLVGQAPASPAGPLAAEDAQWLPEPPAIALPRALQVIRFNQRQIEFVFRARRELGEVFRMRGVVPDGPVLTSHPDHVRSLFTAKPDTARTGPARKSTAMSTCITVACCCRHSTARRSSATRR